MLKPMALCGLGGSRSKTISDGMVVVAGLGAFGLGAVIGGIGGSIAGRIKRGQRSTLTGGLDDAFRTPVG
jgi:hypothetical protein